MPLDWTGLCHITMWDAKFKIHSRDWLLTSGSIIQHMPFEFLMGNFAAMWPMEIP